MATNNAVNNNAITTIGSSTNLGIVTWSGTAGTTVLNNSPTIDASGRFTGAIGTTSNNSYGTSAANTGVNSTGSLNLGLIVSGTTRVTCDNNGVTVGVNGTTTVGNGLILKRVSKAISYTLTSSDCIVGCTDNSSARTFTLPSTGTSAGVFIIKDEAGTAASANNITVTVTGGTKTIDGTTTKLITTNYGSLTVYWDGTNYFTIS